MLAPAPTEATNRMPAEPPTPVAPQAPAPPRRPAAPAAPRPAPAAARPKRSLAGRLLRAIGVLALIAVLAAVIAGAVLLLTDAGRQTDIGELIRDNVEDQIQAAEDFIRENTP
jgi:hypothetical protein